MFPGVKIQFCLLTCMSVMAAYAQEDPYPALNIGDPAPPLRIQKWFKGNPIQHFEKGKIYVIEFWATWCKPCKAAMPHLSDLARKYKESVNVLGIDIYELETATGEKVQAFVDSMGSRMDYAVAAEDSNQMVSEWLEASGEKDKGIPMTFVIDQQGRLAWTGHPSHLDTILPHMIKNSWDIKEALAAKNFNRHLEYLDHEADIDLVKYTHVNPLDPNDHGKPDSTLIFINQIITKEPRLKYAPRIAENTFSALLQTNPNKAYEYGKIAMVTSTYEGPNYFAIIDPVKKYSGKLKLPSNIYQLGAEAHQAEIDHFPYPELLNLAERYHQMANWYSQAGNKPKAIESQQKAIEALKNKGNSSKTDIAAFESQLYQFMQQ